MRLVVITPEALTPGEPAVARAMLQRGLDTLHLRKPAASRAHVAAYLAELGDPWTRHVMLHSHHDVARDFPVKGLHFREADVPGAAPPMPPPLMPGLAQSTSFHQLARASEPWGPALTYAFLSPVFDSISKPGYPAAGFASAEVRRVASAPGAVPLIALGGVTEGNLAAAAGMGFAGAAVLGGVWHRADPVAAVEALLRVCRGLLEQGAGDGEGVCEAGPAHTLTARSD